MIESNITLFNNLTIKTKLMILSGVLLSVFIITNILGVTNAVSMRDEDALVKELLLEQKEAIGRLTLLNDSLRQFSEMKYWVHPQQFNRR